MREVFSLAFSDFETEITDEQYDEIFISVMEEQSELIEKSFAEKTMDIECIKIEDKWYIDELDDEILDVLMANMISTIEDIDDFD